MWPEGIETPLAAKEPPGQIPAGYWRGEMTVIPTGVTSWHLRIPGVLATVTTKRCFRAFDRHREVRLERCIRGNDGIPRDKMIAAFLPYTDVEGFEPSEHHDFCEGRLKAQGPWGRLDQGNRFRWRLVGVCGYNDDLVLCNMDVTDRWQQKWAIATWKSLGYAQQRN